jgi:hypothetical protein
MCVLYLYIQDADIKIDAGESESDVIASDPAHKDGAICEVWYDQKYTSDIGAICEVWYDQNDTSNISFTQPNTTTGVILLSVFLSLAIVCCCFACYVQTILVRRTGRV